MFSSDQSQTDSLDSNRKHRLSRRQVMAVMSSAAVSAGCWRLFADASRSSESNVSTRVGVSLAGAEFGAHREEFCNTQPGQHGVDYVYPSQATIDYFAAAGLGLFRIPFRWERLQPNLGKALNFREVNLLIQSVRWVTLAGGKVILDLHNYGRYCLNHRGNPRPVIVGEDVAGRSPVTKDHLADFWQRLAKVFAANPTIAGYGLMNEPHDMGSSDWKAISQHLVDAIRDVDRNTHVLIAGDGWSNAHRWSEIHSSKAWIKDPANRFAYEAHCYFDADASGKYELSFDEELKRDPNLLNRGQLRVSHFLDWCRQNRVSGFLGEFGIPRSEPRWHTVMQRCLDAVAEVNFPICYWAAGEWWGDYPLSIQPSDTPGGPPPQLKLLQKYSKKA